MSRKLLIPFIIGLLLLGFAGITFPAAASNQQPQSYYYTPTADLNGRIVYKVKKDETCLSISLLTGTTIDDLRRLNNLGEDCVLTENMDLLLAVVTPVTPTTGPSQTPTPVLPSPTPFAGNAEVCVYLYEDINGNALSEIGENSLPGGAISISDQLGKFSLTGKTEIEDKPTCFADVPEGKYTVSVAVPQGYNATTHVSYSLTVKAGDKIVLDFGAQISGSVNQPSTDGQNSNDTKTSTQTNSPILGIVGGIILLAGLLLGAYAWLMGRRRNPF